MTTSNYRGDPSASITSSRLRGTRLALQAAMRPRVARFLVLPYLLALGCGGESNRNAPGSGGSENQAGSATGGDAGSGAGAGGNAGAGTGGGGAGGDGNAGTSGTGAFTPDQGCRSDGNCAGHRRGGTCFRFEGDGPGVCGRSIEPVTECTVDTPSNDCCSSDECGGARCFAVLREPVQCSSTGGFDVANQCVRDTCQSDDDCAEGLCSPEGLGIGRACVPAACRSDADCKAEAGGVCAYFELGCCTTELGGAPARSPEIACVYPSSGCQADTDCPNGEHCVIRNGRAECSSSCP
jgi:hypothetical protein